MDIITERLIAIGRQALASLRGLRTDIQQLIGAVSNSHKAEDQQQQQQPPIVRAELYIPEAIERDKGERDDRQHRVQIWLAIATTLAFIAAAVYAGIAAYQLVELRKQTDAVRCAAVAATNSVYIAAAALQENQRQFNKTLGEMKGQTTAQQSASETASKGLLVGSRAWISPFAAGLQEAPTIDHAIKLGVRYGNRGRSPALDVHPVFIIRPISGFHFDDNSINSLIEATDLCKGLAVAPGADVIYSDQPGDYELHIGVKDPKWLTEDMIDGRTAIVIQMCMAYKTMDTVHHTSFCYFYRNGVTENFAQLNICTAGNHAD